jgi:hypothetical protein
LEVFCRGNRIIPLPPKQFQKVARIHALLVNFFDSGT